MTSPVVARPVLEMRGIAKSFPGVRALEGVDLTLYPGEVTALIGENGAGKSTLVKILTGIYQPDAGTIRVDGDDRTFPDAEAAMHAGVSAIHQETVLFDELSVVENIFLGHQLTGRFGLLDWPAMRARSRAILESLDPTINPSTRLKDLGIARKHLVAIARALSVEATRIVIMDEPTAALSYKEVEDLYRIVDRLKRQGKAILFISHKFEEIFKIADRYSVFRDGRPVGEGMVADATANELISKMVGRTVDHIFPKVDVPLGETVLEVEGLSHPTEFADISFKLRKGEILGFYGLVGAGRSEVMQCLFGVTRSSSGTIRLNGETVAPQTSSQAIDAGIVYVPEERGRQGTISAMPIYQNLTLPSLRHIARKGFLDVVREFEITRRYAERLDLRAATLSQPVGTLSGGNQQKVVIGKWLATEPKVIILDEPTKGIDVGSKSAVHGFMSELAGQGLSVIMVSSELPEILGMSDRVIVMREGRIAGVFERGAVTAEELVGVATGNSAKEAA